MSILFDFMVSFSLQLAFRDCPLHVFECFNFGVAVIFDEKQMVDGKDEPENYNVHNYHANC